MKNIFKMIDRYNLATIDILMNINNVFYAVERLYLTYNNEIVVNDDNRNNDVDISMHCNRHEIKKHIITFCRDNNYDTSDIVSYRVTINRNDGDCTLSTYTCIYDFKSNEVIKTQNEWVDENSF